MKKIALITMLAVCALGATAQENASEEEALKMREMNDIKWSENAICAEVIEYMADDSEKTITVAQQKSMQLLQAHVIEIFAKRMNMEKQDVQEIWDVIDDKCQNIEVRKGDIVRVFTYIMKDALGLSRSKPKEKDLEEYFGKLDVAQEQDATEVKVDSVNTVMAVKNDTAVIAAEVPVVEEKTIVKDSIPTLLNPTKESNDTVVVAAPKENKDTVVVAAPKENKDTVVVAAPVVETVKPDTLKITTPEVAAQPATPVVETPVTPVPQPEAPKAAPEVKVPELCQTMLEKKDMTTLLKFLDTEKAYENLIYGNERGMRRVADCYIIIVDKATKNIETVLDKGAADRMNFVTKQMDNFNNYRGGGKYSAIFVQPLK